MNKKNIMFIANGGRAWIGGLYYVKNIIYSITQNAKLMDKINIFIIVRNENIDVFSKFSKYDNVKIVVYRDTFLNKIFRKASSHIFNKQLDLNILFNCIKYNIDKIYPVNDYPYMCLENKTIFWIPDFQHIYLPDLFSAKEIKHRNYIYNYIAKYHHKLVLSSNDAYNQYKKLYANYTDNVYVIPFVSDIEDEIINIKEDFISKVLAKYNLKNGFLFIPNQFFAHKNHITAFKAINFLVNEKKVNVTLVCTGNTEDYRNKKYFDYLLNYIKDNKLENNIKILGFISRKEQIALMKSSAMIIQPSLFEGWGTGVEDAKALDKSVLMSDIDVHFEQAYYKSIIFKKTDYICLADEILNNINNKLNENIENGIKYIQNTSYAYSNKIYNLLF